MLQVLDLLIDLILLLISTKEINITGVTTGLSVSGVGTIGTLEVTNATISGNLSIGGTLTYEDVTSIDSVGLITARSGMVVSGVSTFLGSQKGINASGISTFRDQINVSDNVKLTIGDGEDLQIFWNGSQGFITNQGGAVIYTSIKCTFT